MKSAQVVVVGAGPAGLTAALHAARSWDTTVFEQSHQVGGISRTERHGGFRFDVGGHRFFTRIPRVQQLWEQMLGDDFHRRQRLSRIYFDGKFFDYPLRPTNALTQLGAGETLRIGSSYLYAQCFPRSEESFEDWVVNRFGDRLYQTFFRRYTEKVWGVPCSRIRADWAAQRIQGLNLARAALDAFTGRGQEKTLTRTFHYPAGGPGQMWEAFAEKFKQQGGRIRFGQRLIGLEHDGRNVTAAHFKSHSHSHSVRAAHYLSSIALGPLVLGLSPRPPRSVVQAAQALRYRDFLQVGLILDQPSVFSDNWIYVHTPGVRVGRIQNFKNWHPAMVPDPRWTSLGMEYFCSKGDTLWELPDEALIELAKTELGRLDIADPGLVRDAVVIRQRRAYPVYDEHYRQHIDCIRDYLSRFSNLQTMGRNGLHRYNNQDHSMLTGIQAVENLEGRDHVLWDINTDRSYQEDFQLPQTQTSPSARTH